jgi:two-component sensor histidine kinase
MHARLREIHAKAKKLYFLSSSLLNLKKKYSERNKKKVNGTSDRDKTLYLICNV